MNYIEHKVHNQIVAYTSSTTIDCNKEHINSISFKVKGAGEVIINSMPIDQTDGIVSFFNNMPVRDTTTYQLSIPTGTVVYVIKTRIEQSAVKDTTLKC